MMSEGMMGEGAMTFAMWGGGLVTLFVTILAIVAVVTFVRGR